MNHQALLLSLEVATLATALAGLAGVALAGVLARGPFPGRELLDVLVTAPLALPPTVLGFFLLSALGRTSPLGQAWEAVTGSPLVFSFSGAVLAASVAALPFVVRTARAGMESVDPRLVAAAQTLGAGPWRVFSTVVLPLSSRAVAAGVMLGFARALGDFGVTLMVAGDIPGVTRTASLAVYGLLLAGREQEATGLALVLAAMAMGVLAAVSWLTRRRPDGF